jgi:hypothetical protein
LAAWLESGLAVSPGPGEPCTSASAGALALGLVLTAQQEASAWTKWSVNAGISINYEGGNNNFLWGMFRSGQVPGYPTDVYMGAAFGDGGLTPLVSPDWSYSCPGCALNGSTAPATTEPPAAAPKSNTQAIYYPNQPAAYYPNAGSYQYPAYGYSYGNGYGYAQQAPSYWYGR